jgi:hypothetical protein
MIIHHIGNDLGCRGRGELTPENEKKQQVQRFRAWQENPMNPMMRKARQRTRKRSIERRGKEIKLVCPITIVPYIKNNSRCCGS